MPSTSNLPSSRIPPGGPTPHAQSGTLSAMSRRLTAAVMFSAVCSLVLAVPAAAHADRPATSAPSPHLVTITIPARHGEIPAGWLPYSGPPRAAVLLPAGYDPHRRYPLVLNLGGLGGDYAQAAFGPSLRINAIVVTPEPYDGWYADWWNHGKRGDPAWESYFLDDVTPGILARYPILPQRRFHAVVGISMGGLGATFLGGRLPGFFGSVATLSGFVDPQFFGFITGEAMGLISSGLIGSPTNLYDVYGPPDGFYATGHNPTRLVMNLKQTRVFESTGTGVPSNVVVTNNPADIPAGSALEGLIIHPMNDDFHHAAEAAGIDLTFQAHRGGHDAADFSQEIAAWLAWGPFKPVVNHSAAWTNDTVASHGQLWDVGYRFAEPPTKVVRFNKTGDLLTISAAGSPVTIATPVCTVRTKTPAVLHLCIK